jgi:RHS repeat-associated protein
VIYTETYTYDDANNNGQYYKISKTILGDTNSPSITTNIYINKFGQTEKQESMHSSNYMYTYKYDYLGNKIEEKSARANDENWNQPYTSKYEYNYAGKVTKTYNVNGDYSTIEYDALGRVKTETDIKGNKASPIYSTTYSYDNLGRVLEEKKPFENINDTVYYSDKKHYYDLNGNIILEKVAQNKSDEATAYTQTKNEYNNRNMLVKVITYDKEVPANFTQYYYDGIGNKIRMYTGLSSSLIINGLDNVTTTGDTDYSVTKYEYNQFNKLAKMTDALGNSETYNYDYNGNLVQHIDRNGNIIVMTYDGLNNILSKAVTTPDGSGNSSNIYTYTITGKMASMSCGKNSTTYVYDDLGRLITEAESNGITKDYSYDAEDNRKSLVIKQNGAVKENTTYTYDNMNRLYQVLENGQLSATYSYDANGNREGLEYTNGNSTEYQYNLGNKLIQLTNKKGTSTISQYNYTYYLDGNQASKNDSTTGLTSYVYDGFGRLSSVSEPGSVVTTYQYDDRNNRRAMTIRSGANAGTTTYEYDKNNRLLKEMKAAGENETDITRYGYDANGNQTYKENETLKPVVTGDTESLNMYIVGQDASDDASLYQYDGFNQLIKSIVGDKTVTYEYDGNGLRTSKTVNGAATTQVWDGDQIALELNGSGAVTNKYVRGINLIYGDDGTGSNKKFYLFNGHGDVIQLTDNTGTVVKNYDYDAFGNEKNIDPNDTNVFRYCGEYFDKETGTIYLRARYYDSSIGRFITEDSYEGKANDPLSLNLYTYCGNNPVNFFDSSGHTTTSEGVAVHSAVEAYFMSLYPLFGQVEFYIPKNASTNKSGSGYADMVLSYEYQTQVYELKTTTYFYDFKYNVSGKAQLNSYIQAMKANGITNPKAGTTFNPNGVVLPYPGNPKKEIVLSTHYEKDPGMIYYYIRNTKTQEEPKTVETVEKTAITTAIIGGLIKVVKSAYDVWNSAGRPVPVFP